MFITPACWLRQEASSAGLLETLAAASTGTANGKTSFIKTSPPKTAKRLIAMEKRSAGDFTLAQNITRTGKALAALKAYMNSLNF